ncbi:MAG: transposase [Hahellaceae bacterium]|nr:transposase [Hahellaceae bacterium]
MLNDHDNLRSDLAFQTALNHHARQQSDAGQMEQACRRSCRRISSMAAFLVLHPKVVLDFDATDIGYMVSKGRFFNGYYDHYCYLPLYVFCGCWSAICDQAISMGKHSWAITSLLVKFIPAIGLIPRLSCGTAVCRPVCAGAPWALPPAPAKSQKGFVIAANA